jgi:hypothetical protein
MWTPYRTRNNTNNINKSNGRQEMYSHRDYLRAVLESGEKISVENIIMSSIYPFRFCTS